MSPTRASPKAGISTAFTHELRIYAKRGQEVPLDNGNGRLSAKKHRKFPYLWDWHDRLIPASLRAERRGRRCSLIAELTTSKNLARTNNEQHVSLYAAPGAELNQAPSHFGAANPPAGIIDAKNLEAAVNEIVGDMQCGACAATISQTVQVLDLGGGRKAAVIVTITTESDQFL